VNKSKFTDHEVLIFQAVEEAAENLQSENLVEQAISFYRLSQEILDRPGTPIDALRKSLLNQLEK
jgi:hypothetical protein